MCLFSTYETKWQVGPKFINDHMYYISSTSLFQTFLISSEPSAFLHSQECLLEDTFQLDYSLASQDRKRKLPVSLGE